VNASVLDSTRLQNVRSHDMNFVPFTLENCDPSTKLIVSLFHSLPPA
jgi:hypothetical protein